MATTPVTGPEAKIDVAKAEAAAEKAYAQAAADVAPKAEPKLAAAAAPVAAPVASLTAAAVKVAAPKKVAAKKVAVTKVAAQPAAKKVSAKSAVKKVVKQPAKRVAKVTPFIKLKDTIMTKTKTKTTTEDYTAKLKDVVATAQDRAKAAFEKTSAYAGEYGEFTKGNLEAVVESSKILAAGLQDMGKAYVAEGKSAIETVTADVKEIAAVKSPADFFKLQGEMMRRNFDAAVASTSKRSEAMVKLAGDAFAPISTRVSLAVEKVKQAA